jgi:heme-degrading monooxygenase HmoA
MFIAMNQFKVAAGREADFEAGWRRRESYLDQTPGFVHFALLKGDEQGDYISHTIWASREAFIGWTQSDAFRRAHAGGMPEGVIEGHPRARFYDSVITESGPVPANLG